MKKNNLSLDNVKFEVALEILSMKIALTIFKKDQKELEKLLIEQNELYTYDEKIINEVFDVYGSEIKKMLKGG